MSPGLQVGVLCRRARLVVVLVALGAISTGVAGVAQADTASDLEAARDAYASARAAANETAAELSSAGARLEGLEARIGVLETEIAESQQREALLSGVVRARARTAYRHAGDNHLGVLLDAAGPLDAARRARFLDQANEKENLDIKELAATRADLEVAERELGVQRDDQKQVTDRLEARNLLLQGQLVSAAEARDVLATRLESERTAAAALELAQLRAEQAVAPPATPRSDPSSVAPVAGPAPTPAVPAAGPDLSPGRVVASPGGSFQCPAPGAAYSNNYGPRGAGFHYGIDMFGASGSSLLAVKAGSVTYVANEGAGGNTAYLTGDDGNVYFYAHLSAFAGGARSVSQGEVIGLMGATGNAAGVHLHFEIRVGGANGQRINPYPTLQGAC